MRALVLAFLVLVVPLATAEEVLVDRAGDQLTHLVVADRMVPMDCDVPTADFVGFRVSPTRLEMTMVDLGSTEVVCLGEVLPFRVASLLVFAQTEGGATLWSRDGVHGRFDAETGEEGDSFEVSSLGETLVWDGFDLGDDRFTWVQAVAFAPVGPGSEIVSLDQMLNAEPVG